ncbi:MAG: complement resistance protein TraT [Gammaproteobacteria bacterium]|nr:complement resistance protein TraT [Gammaproteobacteria bacterium]
MRQTTRSITKIAVVGTTVALFAGCAATQTAIEHRNLDTKTNVSKTIFLDPVPQRDKTIYLSAKNTSDEDMDISQRLAAAFREKGYKVTNNPENAHYLLQTNILKVGKMSKSASKDALGGGYGSALAGGAAGAAIGALANNSDAMIAGGVAGGLVGMAADAMVRDVNYTLVTDVQISERVGRGGRVSDPKMQQASRKNGGYERYQTRVVSNADRVNLAFKDARPALESSLVKVLTGIF